MSIRNSRGVRSHETLISLVTLLLFLFAPTSLPRRYRRMVFLAYHVDGCAAQRLSTAAAIDCAYRFGGRGLGQKAPAWRSAGVYGGALNINPENWNADLERARDGLQTIATHQGDWPVSLMFVALSRRQWLKLTWRHTNHHLCQFGR